MNNIFPKLSIFDTLAMMIPGGVTLATLISLLGYQFQLNESIPIEKWIIYTAILFFCYLLGNIVNAIMDIIWYPIRNNPLFLKISKHIYDCSLRPSDSYYICRNLFLFVISTGIIGITTMSLYCKPYIGFILIIAVLFLLLVWIIRQTYDKQSIEEYYKQYYFVTINSINNNISIVESQISFMRNMLFPLTIFCILKGNRVLPDYFPEIINSGLLDAGCFLLFATIIIRQHKIYIMVWDDYKYLKLKEENKL